MAYYCLSENTFSYKTPYYYIDLSLIIMIVCARHITLLKILRDKSLLSFIKLSIIKEFPQERISYIVSTTKNQ